MHLKFLLLIVRFELYLHFTVEMSAMLLRKSIFLLFLFYECEA